MSALETIVSHCSGECNTTRTFEVLVPNQKYRCCGCGSTSSLN